MILRRTQALCPVCLSALPAALRSEGNVVLLERNCPEHGPFSERIWTGPPDLESWTRPRNAPGPAPFQTASAKGCPRDCGRCPKHRQHACTVLLEITRRCNLNCPVCFAASGRSAAPFTPLAEIKAQLDWIQTQTGPVVLQISGGEPTLHPELADMVRHARALFPAVQLNTNGILLADDADLARRLSRAGLSWVFLQFDGLRDSIYRALRGADLLALKKRALAACARAGLAVVLVPTVAAGVNDQDLGDILDFALAQAPAVRGIHLQPITLSGRNPFTFKERLSLPQILAAISRQSKGRIQPEHASPPGCEHERCSFHCRYLLDRDGQLHVLREPDCCCGFADDPPDKPPEALARDRQAGPALFPAPCCPPPAREESAAQAVESVIRCWQGAQPEAAGEDALSSFINQARARTFSVTC
ncbi:MAG: radical SAM protein, partial [Deltaproteobacteria bacterium]|nr:radical SAM protein [Deltaproteobacteria bacterium]